MAPLYITQDTQNVSQNVTYIKPYVTLKTSNKREQGNGNEQKREEREETEKEKERRREEGKNKELTSRSKRISVRNTQVVPMSYFWDSWNPGIYFMYHQEKSLLFLIHIHLVGHILKS